MGNNARIVHSKVARQTTGPDAQRVYGSDWNDDHVLTGLENVDNTPDVDKPVSDATQAALDGKQPLDPTLTGLAALDDTGGLLVETAEDTFTKRTLVGPSDGLAIANADGVAGNPTFSLTNDLSALEGLASTGLAVRTAADTWAQRSITAGYAITVTNGDGVAGNITVAVTDPELVALGGLTSAADKLPYFTGSGTAALADFTATARSLLDDTSTSAMRTTLGVAIGSDVQAYDADLAALAANATSGFWARTGAGTGAARTLTAPASGLTISNPAGTAGNPAFALANDLAAVEALSSTGIARRTGTDTWSVGTAVANAELAQSPDGTIKANISGSAQPPADYTITSVLDKLFGTTQGSVVYRGASSWAALTPGTSGQFLKTLGAATNPAWDSIPGGGDMLAANNLSDLANKATARGNLGVEILRWDNFIINGDFTINQRSGTKTPGVGVYGYDRWKGHASGLEQVVEALPAGEYTLSWVGGGSGTFAGTTAGSPFKATTAGGNVSVVVPSNATKVCLLRGDATNETNPFPARHIRREIELCEPYFNCSFLDAGKTDAATAAILIGAGTTSAYGAIEFPRTMRAVPTLTFYNASNGGASGQVRFNGANLPVTSFFASRNRINFVGVASGGAANAPMAFHYTADAEL